MTSSYDPKDPSPQVCDHCRKYGPPLPDALTSVPPNWRRSLKVLANGGNITDAAKAGDMDRKTLRAALDGKENKFFRAALQRLMVDKGLTAEVVIDALKEGLKADKHQWNPEEKEFDAFPDHSTRVGVAKHVMRQWGAEEPKEAVEMNHQNVGVQVTINTNLGSESRQAVPGTLVARPVEKEVKEIAAERDGDSGEVHVPQPEREGSGDAREPVGVVHSARESGE